MKFLVLVLAIALVGCTTGRAVNQGPVVDMRGVDQAKYNNDRSDCTHEKMETKFPYSDWPIITNCMEKRGYVIIERAG